MATMHPEVFIKDPFVKKTEKDIAKKVYDGDGEKIVFELLNKALPEDYHVFHSTRNYAISKSGELLEKETDFIIYNRNYGAICLEVKNSIFSYDPDYRRYKDGTIVGEWVLDNHFVKDKDGNSLIINGKKVKETMSHFGPWHQAKMEQINLRDAINEARRKTDIKGNCKVLYAVWALQIPEANAENATWPGEAVKELTLFKDDVVRAEADISTLKNRIDQIFSYKISIPDQRSKLDGSEIAISVKTEIDDAFENMLFSEVFSPKCALFDYKENRKLNAKRKSIKFLKRQQQVLDFTSLQQFVAINGAAGTGKTLVAVKKAEELAKECNSSKGEKVIFLCLNRDLCNYLSTNYEHPNIVYKTISEFINSDLCDNKKFTDNSEKDSYAMEKLQRITKQADFNLPYKHFIIDECQDFASPNEDETFYLELIADLVKTKNPDGCFYVFYDELQRVNGKQNFELPSYISNAEAKLTLVTNCRNTKNIALATLAPMFVTYLNKIYKQIEADVNNKEGLLIEQKQELIKRRKDIEENNIIRRQVNVLKTDLDSGKQPSMYFVDKYNNEQERKELLKDTVNKIIDKYLEQKNSNGNPLNKKEDIVILTARSVSSSLFSKASDTYENEKELEEWKYNKSKIAFRTTSQFKGLESKFVILIEVDKNLFINDPMTYYVGTSRAMNDLAIVTTLNENDCKELVTEWICKDKIGPNYKTSFINYMKCRRG